jgi:hypothetical protein
MPSQQQSSRQFSKSKSSKKSIPVKGKVDIDFFIVSGENLEQLKDYSGSSANFDIALFLLGLAISLVTTLVTTEIKNRILFAILLSAASVSLVIGIFKYIGYCRSKKNILHVLNKIKRNKCDLL